MDNLLLNLSILSKIPQKGRLGLDKNGIISIEDDGISKSITRYFYKISRTDALNSIDSIIKITSEKIDDIINSKWLDTSHNFDINNKYKEKKDELFNIKEHLISSVSGIENLKHTYHNDMYTILKIDSYIKKILSLVNMLEDNESKK